MNRPVAQDWSDSSRGLAALLARAGLGERAAFAAGDRTQLNGFTQTFTQQQVPVPSMPWLLVAAGLAWFAVKRRKLPKRRPHH